MSYVKKQTPSLDDAISAMRAWYYSEVREWAEDFDSRILAGEWEDYESFDESFREELDNSQIVIYTFRARAACLASDNEDAYSDEFGELPKNDDGSLRWEAMAYMALMRDVTGAMQVELNEDTFAAATARKVRRERAAKRKAAKPA